MDRLQQGECILLNDEGENIILCDIIRYQGEGYYYVHLTRDAYAPSASRYTGISSIHESIIQELIIDPEAFGLT